MYLPLIFLLYDFDMYVYDKKLRNKLVLFYIAAATKLYIIKRLRLY